MIHQVHDWFYTSVDESLEDLEGDTCCRYLHRLELLRQAQVKDSHSGH